MRNYKVCVNYQFKYYVFLSILYATMMITSQAVAYRLIQIGPFLEPGGIFIFPATFVLSDVISEVYGPTLARRTILMSLFAQAFYSVIPIIINRMPYPQSWAHYNEYHLVFDRSWLVFLSNLAAVLIGMVFNTQLIARTKLLVSGKYFSIRSLISSTVGELILTAIIVSIALVPVEGFWLGFKMFINMFAFKVAYSVIAVIPASFLVVLFKKLDDVDVYEEYVSLNPLRAIFGHVATHKESNVVSLNQR